MAIYHSIIPLKGCASYGMVSTRYMEAVDRITKGPLDLSGGAGLHPIYMISAGENYYLFEVEYFGEHKKTEIVGYAEISYYKISDEYDDSDECDELKFRIKRFEIFREYRGCDYGKIFAKKVMKPEEYLPYTLKSKCVGIEIAEMTAYSFPFWWKVASHDILNDIFICIFDTDNELGEDIETYLKRQGHDKIVNDILRRVNIIMKTESDWTIASIAGFVENTDEYKNCMEHLENTKCNICFGYYPHLSYTACGGNCHEDGCKYKKICEKCCDLLIKQESECPGRCKGGTICKLYVESVYSASGEL